MKHSRVCTSILAGILAIAGWTVGAVNLIDVDFVARTTSEAGFAATGVTSSDYWNAFPAIQNGSDTGQGVLVNLEYMNGVSSGVGLAVTNAAGGANNGSSDSMYSTYLYALGSGPMTVLVTNLPAGTYSFYLYGHGNVANQSSVFQLSCGSLNYGTNATATSGTAWQSTTWQLGQQYVVFSNVVVDDGQPVSINVYPDPAGYEIMSGLQIQTAGSATVTVTASSQTVATLANTAVPITLNAVASDGGTVAYTVLTQPTNGTLTGVAPNLVYTPATNFAGSDGFSFTAQEGTNISGIATVGISVAAPGTGGLIDVDLVAVTTSEVGFAATGITSTDYWNAFPAIQNGQDTGTGVVPNMKYVNGVPSGAGLIVNNAAGGDNNGASDQMYSTYLYSLGGNITLSVTNLPNGVYSFYLYGHGNGANQSSVFQLSCGSVNYGTNATASSGTAWQSSTWQLGQQYVVFSNVVVAGGAPVAITVYQDPAGYSIMSGLQIQSSDSVAPAVTATSQTVTTLENTSVPVTLNAFATDGGTVTYTVLSQPTNGSLTGIAPNLVYSPATNFTGSDGFTFSAQEGTNMSGVATVSIAVAATGFSGLIDVDLVAVTTSEVGFAATGITSTDYWNAFPAIQNGQDTGTGVVPNMKYVNGVSSAPA